MDKQQNAYLRDVSQMKSQPTHDKISRELIKLWDAVYNLTGRKVQDKPWDEARAAIRHHIKGAVDPIKFGVEGDLFVLKSPQQ